MVNWSSCCCSEGQKRSILTENNVLIFSIFASEWGNGRKYLKNERRASPSPKEKKKRGKNGLPKPLRRRGCTWRSKVGSRGLLVMSTGRSDVFHLLKGIFQWDGQQRVRKLPFYMVVERNKGKRSRASPSPSGGGDVPGGMGLGTLVCGCGAIKFLTEKGRRISLYCAKTLQ